MSFLTPLYILGMAAISLPILFHLIRRAPKGVQPFSSLMFISATPPRLTKRSRIDQWLLLLLRAVVIGLLAFAFARPFLRSAATADLSNTSNRVFAVLIDTSGSMRRQGIWQQVEAEVEKALQNLGPQDSIALYHFGDRPERIASFEESRKLGPSGCQELIRKRLSQLRLSWGESSLGDAMIMAADDLDAVEDTDPATQGRTASDEASANGTAPGRRATVRQLIVISDLQRGSHIESLQAYEWPQSVNVIFRRVEPLAPGNASLQVMGSLTDEDDERGVRVRVANSADAVQQQFKVGWADAAQNSLGTTLGVSVPPGETRVVHIPRLPPQHTPTHLLLTGDAQDFDNRFFVAANTPTTGSLVYFGPEADDDPEQMLYYLKRAVTNDQWQQIEIINEGQAATDALETERPLLVVITRQLEPAEQTAVRKYMQEGGTGLLVLSNPEDTDIADTLGAESLGKAVDVTPKDYALWSEVDFSDRLFRPFANPLYNDFSKVHFWKYRQITLPSDDANWVEGNRVDGSSDAWKTIVRYDSGDAAILASRVENGLLYVFTATWNPEESQLARSSKFVPLLTRIIDTDSPLRGIGFEVNGEITVTRPADTAAKITKPDGTVVPIASDHDEFSGTDQPGLYELQMGDEDHVLAVNVARAETRTAPLDVAQLEQRGVRQGEGSTHAEELEALRQMRDIDLEAKQSTWQWLLAAALLLLIAETVIASRWSLRRTTNRESASQETATAEA